MAKSAKQYFEEMCREAGLTPEETQSALAFVSNDKLTSRLDSLVRTGTEDYQAQLGRVRAADQKLQEYANWYGTASAEYSKMADELARLKAGVGQPNGIPDINNLDLSRYTTKEDIAKIVQDQGARFATVIKQATGITADHVARFHEKPDLEAIDRIAQERNVPLDTAYEIYIRPRVDEQAKLDLDRKIKDARDEAVRDYASRHRLPVDPVPAENSYINPRGPRPDAPKDIDAELLDTWRNAGKAAA